MLNFIKICDGCATPLLQVSNGNLVAWIRQIELGNFQRIICADCGRSYRLTNQGTDISFQEISSTI